MKIIQEIKNIIKKIKLLKLIIRYFKIKKMLKFPMQVQIETTSVCNSACITCSHKTMARPKTHMDFNLFKRIIDDCAQNRKYIKRMGLFFMGEPFLAPNIFKEIDYAKLKGIKYVFLISNGSILNKKIAEKILNSELDEIVFSIDGATKETFEKIRVGLDFEQVISNITNLLELRKQLNKTKPKIVIDMVVTPNGENEVKQLKEKWQGLADHVVVRSMHYFEGIDKDLIAYAKKGQKKTIKEFPCPYPWKSLTIFQDGQVSLCCMDINGRNIIGDISQSSVKDIWHGKLMNKYRQLHLINKKNDISACLNCDFHKVKGKPWWWF